MKKILFIGPEVSDFLNPLAGELRKLSYTVDLLENRKNPRSSPNRIAPYSNVIDYQELSRRRITLFEIVKLLVSVKFYGQLLKNIFLNSLDGKYTLLKTIKKYFTEYHRREIFSPLFAKYDVISMHALTAETLSFTGFINNKSKLILTFWGSDLYQIWGFESNDFDSIRDFYESYTALKKADIITLISHEMERVVIAKFGAAMQPKIIRTFFSSNDPQFDLIDKFKDSPAIKEFIDKYRIKQNKIKITIGYCGDPICNHLLIINELKKLDASIKDKLHILVPMTYGGYSDEYKKEVINNLDQSNISYTLFDQYLPLEEVVATRLTSDVMIQMSKSDALSSSVCEAIYAGNILISAIWLPYSPFRSQNIFFYETDFRSLTEIVSNVINNFDEIKLKLDINPERIRELTALNKTVNRWTEMIEAAK